MTSSGSSAQEAPTQSRMWPVDYILKSSYSPLHLENQLPKREWRDAFEDLLALESNGEMISLESRKQEREVANKIIYGKASDSIYIVNRRLRILARGRKRALETREKAMLVGDMSEVSEADQDLSKIRSVVDEIVKSSNAMTKGVETLKRFPASGFKMKGHWIASLVSSGVLPGWSSRVERGPRYLEQRIWVGQMAHPPMNSEESIGFAFTENELRQRFEGTKFAKIKTPSGGADSRAASLRSDEVTINDNRDAGRSSSGVTPSPQSPTAQTVTSERVLLSDGSAVNKVVLTNHFSNGSEERIEITQDAAKVLDEVEKARWLMQGFRITW